MSFRRSLYSILGVVLAGVIATLWLKPRNIGRLPHSDPSERSLPAANELSVDSPLQEQPDRLPRPAQQSRVVQQENETEGQDERLGLEIANAEPLEFEDEHPHTLGRWLGTLSPHPSAWPQRESGASLPLQMPDGETLEIVLEVGENYGGNKGLRAGHVAGHAFSEVIVSYVNEAVAGVVRLPDQGISWEIRNQGDGVLEFEKVDLSELKGCARCKRGDG